LIEPPIWKSPIDPYITHVLAQGVVHITSKICKFSSSYSRWVLALWILQIVGYGIGLTFPVYENVQSHNMLAEIIRKISSFLFYFSVGNLGTLLGFIDFLCGRKIEKWEPLKSKQ